MRSHSICIFLTYFNIMLQGSSMLSQMAGLPSFLWLKYIYSSRFLFFFFPCWLFHVFFIHFLSLDVWVISMSWLLQIMLLWTLGCRYIFEITSVISFPLGIYSEVDFLHHMVAPFLIFWEISILFSVMAVPIYIPTNSTQVFPFLQHLLTLLDNSHAGRYSSSWFWFAFSWY